MLESISITNSLIILAVVILSLIVPCILLNKICFLIEDNVKHRWFYICIIFFVIGYIWPLTIILMFFEKEELLNFKNNFFID